MALDDARLLHRPANIHEVTVADNLLHGEEKLVYGDAGLGMYKREELKGCQVKWDIALRNNLRLKLNEADKQVEKLKASLEPK